MQVCRQGRTLILLLLLQDHRLKPACADGRRRLKPQCTGERPPVAGLPITALLLGEAGGA